MRDILFRGKRQDNGEWVEGYYIKAKWYLDGKEMHIIFPLDVAIFPHTEVSEYEEIIPKTIGQYTGLTDKNGKKIFEGDIFHLDDEVVAVVIFQNGSFRLEEYGLTGTFTESGFDECGGGWDVIDCSPIDWYTINDMEVIGNIHDNPELLGGEP